nr:calcium/sodium antiporter [uncultured Desulfobacter sp.]
MILYLFSVIAGFLLLIWSADRFVEGSSITAKRLGMPPLLIGMIIVGFGTSTPELLVSAMSSYSGNSGIAIGNALGSNICNIALILGLTSMINPISVKSIVLKKELPALTFITFVLYFFMRDKYLSRFESGVLLLFFATLLIWSLLQNKGDKEDPLGKEINNNLKQTEMPFYKAIFWMITGLGFLLLSSRMLVTGAVGIATAMGIDDIIIGLTVVAIGTSLPELASSVAAARRNEHDIALGNIIGSNLFNILAVLGIAGVINPLSAGSEVLIRDLPVMSGLTVSLFIIGYGFRGRPGRINRFEGTLLFMSYVCYTAWLIISQI